MKIVKVFLSALVLSLTIISCQKDPEFLENKPPVVNAGNDTTFELSKSVHSLQLNGSATDTDGSVVSYLWSQVSGPSIASILSPGSATTMVGDLIPGTYVFQLMAVDNEGATGVETVSVTVLAPKVYTITLQPANNPNETVISSLDPGNNAALQELPVAAWTINGDYTEVRSLLKFDLSAVPAGATVVSAKLNLYAVPNPLNGDKIHAHYGTNNAVYIRRITSAWSPLNVTWSNQPATSQANQIELSATNESFKDYINVDVTHMLQDIVSNTNYGMLLQLKSPVIYNIQNFASSKHADASKRPQLVLEYSK